MSKPDPHDDSMLMIPPPGYKFIPRFETVCGRPGCFECFDIFCERCESKDRRIVELEMRNNDLVKYITQLQGKIFGHRPTGSAVSAGSEGQKMGQQQFFEPTQIRQEGPSGSQTQFGQKSPVNMGGEQIGGSSKPFAYIQSPVLYDPNMNVSYIATTTFAPAPHHPPGSSLP